MRRYSSSAGTTRGFGLDFKASAAEVASTTHNLSSTGEDGGELVVTVAVTAVSGTTPTLKIVVEGSVDNDATWIVLGYISGVGYSNGSADTSGAAFGATGTVSGVFPLLPRMRTRSVVGGTTPSFTYSVKAVAC